ncbi:MAG: YraN family protein [Candidatus Binatus sp.]|uniref:YraN family protein n=1 Tax=Candidatus Binatus sp. TaxID=2811406 RepID=UPI003C709A7A
MKSKTTIDAIFQHPGRAVAWLAALGGQVALGRRGERAAERYLRRNGYRIVARNYRAAGAEIDLVAIDGETLVFVEVKTRRSRAAGAPEEAVDERKQTRMRRAAEVFAARYRADEMEMRFDIIAVDASGKRLEIELLRNAF